MFKVILLGETAAGKTSLTTVGVKGGEMDDKVSPTLCSEFASRKLFYNPTVIKFFYHT